MAKKRIPASSGPKPSNNAYTVLLAIALLAQVIGITFLTMDYLNMKDPSKAPALPKMTAEGP